MSITKHVSFRSVLLTSLITIILFAISAYSLFAISNTHSIDLENSSDQYLYVTDANQTGLDLSGDFTVEAWLKIERLPSETAVPGGETFGIISKYLSTGDQRAWSVYIPANTDGGKLVNRLEVAAMADGTNANADTLITTEPIVTTDDIGKWMHLAVSYDISARSIDVYKNGVSFPTTYRAQNGTMTSIYNNSEPVEIGRWNQSSSGEFDGLIDEVRVWNDIRTQTEVEDNMLTSLTGSESGLVAYWNLNNNADDLTSNGNDLTLSGSPTYSDEPAHQITCSFATIFSCLFGLF